MLQYVNGFACSVSEDKNSFILHLRQNEPVISDDGQTTTTETHEIASVIMDGDCANRLLNALVELLTKDTAKPAAKE